MPTFIMLLCYYWTWRRQSAAKKAQPVLSHVQLDLYPVSQFCLFADGISWWTTVTQPPQGILMMNFAMTFSLGNLAFFFFFFVGDDDLIRYKRKHNLFKLSTWLIFINVHCFCSCVHPASLWTLRNSWISKNCHIFYFKYLPQLL